MLIDFEDFSWKEYTHLNLVKIWWFSLKFASAWQRGEQFYTISTDFNDSFCVGKYVKILMNDEWIPDKITDVFNSCEHINDTGASLLGYRDILVSWFRSVEVNAVVKLHDDQWDCWTVYTLFLTLLCSKRSFYQLLVHSP